MSQSDNAEPIFAPAGKLVEAKGLSKATLLAMLDVLHHRFKVENLEYMQEQIRNPGSDRGKQLLEMRAAARKAYAKVHAFVEEYYPTSLGQHLAWKRFKNEVKHQEDTRVAAPAETVPTSGN